MQRRFSYWPVFTCTYSTFTCHMAPVPENRFSTRTVPDNFTENIQKMKRKMMKKIPLVIGIAAVAATALSGVVMLLWNGVLTSVVHVGAVTFWQAAGILVLSKILFGGFRKPGMGGWQMRKRMFMKWDSMSPEQQEEFRSRMQGCGRNWKGRHAAGSAA